MAEYTNKGPIYLTKSQFDNLTNKVAGQEYRIIDDDAPLTEADIINTTQSTSTTNPLSANMGKNLQDQINSISSIGKFLAYWNCSTGQPITQPTSLPYAYHTGDYFVVGVVASSGNTNYKPDGTSYAGTASTVVETSEVAVQDVYRFDGSVWSLSKNTIPDLSGYVATFSQSFTTEQKTQARTNIGAGTINAIDGTPSNPAIINADQLQNHPASYFATSVEVQSKQDSTDNNLQTTAKTVVGAINELNNSKVSTSSYNPDTKLSTMTQSVAKDENGKLWTLPGSSESDAVKYTEQTLTEAQKIQALKNLDGVRIIKLTDSTETLSQLKTRIDTINTNSEHVFFDTASLGYPFYLCTILISYTDSTPVSYRVNDLVTGKTSLGTYNASKTLATILSEAVDSFYTLTVTCVTQDGVTVTGQTVTVRQGGATGNVYATASYNGQPVAFVLPNGFNYYVSVSNTLPSHFNPTTASGSIAIDTAVTLTYSDFSNIKTAQDIKAALDSDIDLTELVGEQITCTRQSTTLYWDVVDYDETNKNVTLLLHYLSLGSLNFDPKQALAYFENGLSAGSYSFKNGSTTYYFTLTTAIPNGGQLYATTSSFTSYESQDSMTALESGSVSTTVIEGATNIGTCASEVGPYVLNNMDRVNYGSNNIKESFIRQWLNSSALPNTNLKGLTLFDRPSSAGSTGGFLYGLDADFISAIGTTTWKCAGNGTYECPASMGGSVLKTAPYTFDEKFLLASHKEIFGVTHGIESGDTQFDWYVGKGNADRIKYNKSGGSAQYWWLRTPHSGVANFVRIVYTSGAESGDRAYLTYGVPAACKIYKSV